MTLSNDRVTLIITLPVFLSLSRWLCSTLGHRFAGWSGGRGTFEVSRRGRWSTSYSLAPFYNRDIACMASVPFIYPLRDHTLPIARLYLKYLSTKRRFILLWIHFFVLPGRTILLFWALTGYIKYLILVIRGWCLSEKNSFFIKSNPHRPKWTFTCYLRLCLLLDDSKLFRYTLQQSQFYSFTFCNGFNLKNYILYILATRKLCVTFHLPHCCRFTSAFRRVSLLYTRITYIYCSFIPHQHL